VPLDHFFVDFCCHELMLAIEIDGFTHGTEEAREMDLARQAKLESLGCFVSAVLYMGCEREFAGSADID
jgi:very-short-patch-repair endonuclease